MLDESDKQWIMQTMARLLEGRTQAAPMPRLTVRQFAAAVDLHPDVVLRKIRTREIAPGLVFGTRPIRLSPKALEQFGVTPEEAKRALTERNLWPASSPSSA